MYRVRAGGSIFTEKISAELGVSFEEAETLKRTLTTESEVRPQLQKIHSNMFGRVFKEFKEVLEAYERQAELQISTVFVVGGGAQYEGCLPLLAEQFGRSVNVGQPFNKVAYPAFMEDTMNQIGTSFTGALGAALRSFE